MKPDGLFFNMHYWSGNLPHRESEPTSDRLRYVADGMAWAKLVTRQISLEHSR